MRGWALIRRRPRGSLSLQVCEPRVGRCRHHFLSERDPSPHPPLREPHPSQPSAAGSGAPNHLEHVGAGQSYAGARVGGSKGLPSGRQQRGLGWRGPGLGAQLCRHRLGRTGPRCQCTCSGLPRVGRAEPTEGLPRVLLGLWDAGHSLHLWSRGCRRKSLSRGPPVGPCPGCAVGP